MRKNSVVKSRPASTMLAFALMLGSGGAAFAQTPLAPEQVVQANAEASSNGDLSGLLAVFADDARSYDRPTDPHKLTGELSDTIGSKDQLAAYFKAEFAKPPLARERILATATVGDVVIAAGESAKPPDYASGMRFLTGYRVRDGQIRDLWHIAWIPADAPTGPDPTEVIRQLIAANNARDADSFLALFSPDAKNFRYSDDPHKLADQPPRTLVDAASREKAFRKYFAGTPVQVKAVKLFSVGDLVVEQSHVTGFADAPEKIVNEVSIYRVRGGRIVDDWLLGEEALPAFAADEPEAVVRNEVAALTEGRLDALVELFAADAVIHQPPTTAHALIGERAAANREQVRRLLETALTRSPQGRFEIADTVALGELVVARVAVAVPSAPDRNNHHLSIFRVRDGAIHGLWQVVKEYGARPDSGTAAKAVVHRLGEANNRGDADAFVALFHPDAKHFHPRRDPARLGGGPSKKVTDLASRRRAYREMFADGAPTQIKTVDGLALGEWVATIDEATHRDGTRVDNLSIYRVRDDLIIDDWHLTDQER